jgi:hypothetical protein
MATRTTAIIYVVSCDNIPDPIEARPSTKRLSRGLLALPKLPHEPRKKDAVPGVFEWAVLGSNQ